uniref:Cx9C motif-containing protein 4, mitochondrial n=1 Tax=Mycena chlorophos TaxID=658473 RepID=A0ABQ0KVM1_MYCCL|nr:predicted protein [Mycena chlorophos]
MTSTSTTLPKPSRLGLMVLQACQSEACALQDCLNKNTHKPEKCDARLRELYECCAGTYEPSTIGEKGKVETTACPKEFVVKRWLKDHPRGSTQ